MFLFHGYDLLHYIRMAAQEYWQLDGLAYCDTKFLIIKKFYNHNHLQYIAKIQIFFLFLKDITFRYC